MSGRKPFDEVRAALHDISPEIEEDDIRIDDSRTARAGIPEVVLAAGKSPEMVVESLRRLATACNRAVATRCTHEQVVRVQQDLGRAFDVTWHEDARAIVVASPGSTVPCLGGNVGILTAGSSDASAASEAALIAREMGANVREVRDVGVAGLHRLVKPLEQLIEAGVDVLIVVAGMDGALASVVAGLVPVPVIGLPTSIGYGHGGGGVGALMSMLQSCAPGLVVVNIDNGVGAGSTAALIANRMAARHAIETGLSPSGRGAVGQPPWPE